MALHPSFTNSFHPVQKATYQTSTTPQLCEFHSIKFTTHVTASHVVNSFGAQQNSNGTWAHVPERIPDDWTTRTTPYSLLDVATQIFEMYGMYPVGIGGNVNDTFVGIDFPPYIQGGNLTTVQPSDVACLLYQFVSGPIPSSLNGFVEPSVDALQAALSAIGGEAFTNLGCPLPVTK